MSDKGQLTVEKSVNDSQSGSRLNKLFEKFERVSSSVHIEFSSKNDQLFEISKSNSLFKDSPLIRLRNLQNKSELNKAELQLLSQRRPKRYMNSKRKEENQVGDSYLSLYKGLQTEKPIFKQKRDTELTSEEDLQLQQVKGVKHSGLLRQHPRLLEYTITKMHEKQHNLQLTKRKEILKDEIKKGSSPERLGDSQQLAQALAKIRKSRQAQTQAQQVIDTQMGKFYSKGSKGVLQSQARENARCSRFLSNQQRILVQMEPRSISKQNLKKLRQRFNLLANQINHSDQKHNHQNLPPLPIDTRILF